MVIPVDGRGGRIRTGDPLHPMQVRYRAAPRPDTANQHNILSGFPTSASRFLILSQRSNYSKVTPRVSRDAQNLTGLTHLDWTVIPSAAEESKTLTSNRSPVPGDVYLKAVILHSVQNDSNSFPLRNS